MFLYFRRLKNLFKKLFFSVSEVTKVTDSWIQFFNMIDQEFSVNVFAALHNITHKITDFN